MCPESYGVTPHTYIVSGLRGRGVTATLRRALPPNAQRPGPAPSPRLRRVVSSRVSPPHAAGPPRMKHPLGLTLILLVASPTWRLGHVSITRERQASATYFCVALAAWC